MRRLLLVRHGATAATERAAFPGDEPLDEQSRMAAAELLAGRFPPEAVAISSPALRACDTAAAAGIDPVIDPQISECDFGLWAGRTLAEVHAEDPDAAVNWMMDPNAAPHGGESLVVFVGRVTSWLDTQMAADGPAVAITHGGVIAAAVTHALGAPLGAVWKIKPSPLSVTELLAADGGWVVEQVGARR